MTFAWSLTFFFIATGSSTRNAARTLLTQTDADHSHHIQEGTPLRLVNCEALDGSSGNRSARDVTPTSLIGTGGFSQVFQVQLNDRTLAMKVYDSEEARPLSRDEVIAAIKVETDILKLGLDMCVRAYYFCQVENDLNKWAILEEVLIKEEGANTIDATEFQATMYEHGFVPLDVGSDNAWHTPRGLVFFDFNAFLDLRKEKAHEMHWWVPPVTQSWGGQRAFRGAEQDLKRLEAALGSFADQNPDSEVIQANVANEISIINGKSPF
eukprot:TRINITY_DN46464_c0_g1_i1.p1 TRINITY_DN46464_c0_g1~~TRINITY_DN46464_c0_g1_i1.p1  ORF type:complete len:267 (-),score=50.73 TRINITY_DN46464_c0_g1_i1:151-951(-)